MLMEPRRIKSPDANGRPRIIGTIGYASASERLIKKLVQNCVKLYATEAVRLNRKGRRDAFYGRESRP